MDRHTFDELLFFKLLKLDQKPKTKATVGVVESHDFGHQPYWDVLLVLSK